MANWSVGGCISSVGACFSKAWDSVRRWLVEFAGLVLIALFALDALGLMQKADLSYSVGVILIFALAERIERIVADQTKAIERIGADQTGLLDKNMKLLEAISQSGSPHLHTLQDCINELSKLFVNLGRGEHIIVRHLGLDMANAWEHFYPLLSNETLLSDVDYQLLILTGNSSKLGQIDPEVERWCNMVKNTMIQRITENAPSIVDAFKINNRKFKFVCREYVYTPFIHGIEVRGAVNLCYIGMCRWGGKKFDELGWGQTNYFRVADTTVNPEEAELRRTFRSYFDHHWLANPHDVVNVSTSP